MYLGLFGVTMFARGQEACRAERLAAIGISDRAAPDDVMIFVEMVHDVRIIPTDGARAEARAAGWETRPLGGRGQPKEHSV